MGLNTCSNVFLVRQCVIMCTRHKHSRSVMLGCECMFWVWSECVSLSKLVSDMSHMQECALNVNLYSGVSTCTCRSIFLVCDTRWVCSWISSRGQFLEVVWRQAEKSQTVNYGKGNMRLAPASLVRFGSLLSLYSRYCQSTFSDLHGKHDWPSLRANRVTKPLSPAGLWQEAIMPGQHMGWGSSSFLSKDLPTHHTSTGLALTC